MIGKPEFKEKVLEEIKESPIMFGKIETKCKLQDKYLGDILHCEGLGASVDATVKDRAGKVKGAMREVAAIMEDFRMQAVGGLQGAWDLWNIAIIPSLLNNCGTWMEISTETVDCLEDLQYSFVRRMLQRLACFRRRV